ncbi:molybdenum cofactor guanylyltransferase [Paraflavitalea speifideaquila]|uniref:molybdenum cofactor guanylyltransferase n=1 Tax=Paraflavitalea speifideaquila TaxID=3076558 RepID=UPI0028E366DF|nr:molybdenum cofactor guanylyltransferase [Paraflavitalea speifideiaquila]
MLGVVLSGGESSRMGIDKGMLRLGEKTWVQSALDKLAALQLQVVVSVNAIQYETYADLLATEQLVKDDASLTVKGPLLGVLSVHQQFPQQDLLVLACDMPLMELSTLEQLMTIYNNRQAAAYVFTDQGEPEPLCAVYTATALATTLRRYQSQELVRYSMKFLLQQLDVFPIPLEEGQEKHFRNFNSPAELDGL